jgi:hypothetical protein
MPRFRARREGVFVCTCTTRAGASSVWVRAWSEEQARELAVAQLRDQGVEPGSELRVVPLDASVATAEAPLI